MIGVDSAEGDTAAEVSAGLQAGVAAALGAVPAPATAAVPDAPAKAASTPPVGSRVVVRYLLPSGQATDALGMLLRADDAELVVDGKRGIEHIARGTVIAAKQVPPPPEPRRPRS